MSSARVTVRDRSGRVHLVYPKNWGFVEESCQVYDTYSTDDGATWSPVYDVSRHGNLCSTGPALAMDSSGTLHCTWFQFWDTIVGKYDYFYSKTLNDTWTTPVNISRMATNTNYAEYSCICADNRGGIHVVFEYSPGPDIYYTRPSGDSWLTPTRISTSPRDDGFPSIASDSRGTLHACWRLRGSDSGYVMYSRYDTAWLPPLRLAAFPTGMNCAMLAVGSDDVVHIACAGDVPTGKNDVFYMKNSGDTWTNPENISSTPQTQSLAPQIGVKDEKTLCAVWTEEMQDGPPQTMCRFLVDGNWLPPVNLSDDTLRGAGLCQIASQVQGGRADVFWAGRMSRDACDFYDTTCIYMLGVSFPSGGVAERFREPGGSAPVASKRTLATGIDAREFPPGTHVQVYDAGGRCVRGFGRVISGQVDRNDDLTMRLNPGVYFLCIVGGELKQVSRIVIVN